MKLRRTLQCNFGLAAVISIDFDPWRLEVFCIAEVRSAMSVLLRLHEAENAGQVR